MSTPAELLGGGEGAGSILDLDAELLNSHAPDSFIESDPPLGTDERAGDAGAGAVKTDTGKESTGAAAGKAGQSQAAGEAGADAGKVDEDLEVDDEERVAKKLSDEDKPIYERTRNSAKFETYFRDGNHPPEQIVDHMKRISPGRYNDVATAVVRDLATDPKRFVSTVLDDDSYSKLYAAMVESNPMWLVERLTGRKDLTLAGLKDLVDGTGGGESAQLKAVIDAMPDFEKIKDSTGEEVGLDELAVDFPEVADYLKAIKLASSDQLPKTFTSKLEAANAEVARLTAELEGKGGGKKVDAQAPNGQNGAAPELSPEAIASHQAVDKTFQNYVAEHAKDKNGLNLLVSEAERTAAPEVADLKDTFYEAWIAGSPNKKIPTFANGVLQHFKGNEKFVAAARQVKYYAERGETENAVAAAKQLNKFIDAYRKVRLDLPYFKSLDRLIAMHSKSAGRSARVERVIAGGGSQTLSPGSDVDQSDEELLNNFGMDQFT